MKTSIASATSRNLRAAAVLIAFTALAAVGFATVQRIERTSAADQATARAALASNTGSAPHAHLLVAPAGAPMSAAAFSVRH